MFRKLRRLIYILIIVIFFLSTIPFVKQKPTSSKSKKTIDLENCSDKLKVKLISLPTDALNYRLALIESAQESIYLCTYNFNVEDKTAKYIIAALLKASLRSVEINLIVDAKFGGLSKKVINLLTKSNINVHLYNPLNIKKPETIQVSLHNKIMLVDKKWIITGGRNINDTFLSDDSNKQRIAHDLDVIVKAERENSTLFKATSEYIHSIIESKYVKTQEGKNNRSLLKYKELLLNGLDNYYKKSNFILNEHISTLNKQLYYADNVTLITSDINPTKKSPDIANILYILSKKYSDDSYIFTPYLVLNSKMIDKIKELSLIKNITLLTNSLYSTPNYPAFSNYLIRRKDVRNLDINVYEYVGKRNHSVHTKAFIISDNICAVGSMNMDNRSLYINLEQMLLIKSRDFYDELLELAKVQINDSININLEPSLIGELKVPLYKRITMKIVGYIFYPLRYFL